MSETVSPFLELQGVSDTFRNFGILFRVDEISRPGRHYLQLTVLELRIMFNIQKRSKAVNDLNLDTGINCTGNFSLIYIFNIFLEFFMNSKLSIRFKHTIYAIIIIVKHKSFLSRHFLLCSTELNIS